MAAKFWVGGAGVWDGTSTTHWAATTGGTAGDPVPVAGDDVTFDGSSGGGLVTLGAAVNVKSITMGAFTGTLDFTNFPDVTLQTFSGTGAGTRTLTMGNGTWKLTGTGTIWTTATTTGLTLNAGTAKINPTDQSATGKTLTGGGLVFYDFFYQGVVASLTLTNMNFTLGATIIPLPYGGIKTEQDYLNTKLGSVGLTKQQALQRLFGAVGSDTTNPMTTQDAATNYAGAGAAGKTIGGALKHKAGASASGVDIDAQEAARRL
jgi:hypothetical protein